MDSNASCADLGPQMSTAPTPKQLQLQAVVLRQNKKLLAEINFDSLLGECGLYFTSVSNPEMTNEEFKKSVGDGAAEFMLVIHLAPFKDIKNDEGVYQTPVELRTLNCPLKTLASLLPHVYGIDAPRLYHVSA
jgi:hypothetical protein